MRSTRSTQKSAGISSKAPARKPRATRSMRTASNPDAWALQAREEEHDTADGRHHYNGNLETISREEPDFDEGHHYNGNLATISREEPDFDGVQETVEEMAHMAERLGAQAETFAIELDKFLNQLPMRNKLDAVLDLIEEFKTVAKEAAFAIQKDHEQETARTLRRQWDEDMPLSTRATTVSLIGKKNTLGYSLTAADAVRTKQWRQWQQEADIWDLFQLILKLHHNPDQAAVQQEKEEELRALGAAHRYTSESDMWQRFLLQDDLAKERAQVKAWLEQTADHQESALPGIMEELQSKASRGKGMWSHGWMETREKIKGEKRVRSWPTTPGATLPQIRNDNRELLVTTLDPDATSRQGRSLQPEDAYLEQAIWITCWEMLRRGTSWQEVSKWCEERNEMWRAVSIGKASNTNDTLSTSEWRNACYLASQADGLSDYEAAVYGMLGGSVRAVQKISRSVDDTLYAHYNAALIRQFDQYLAVNFPQHTPKSRRPSEDALKDPQQQIVDLILRLRKEPRTSSESIQPMKIIQSYLLANDVGSMIHTLGFAIAYTDALREREEDMIVHLRPFWPEDANQPEAEIALDTQTLRIAVHMSIILRVLNDEKLTGEEKDAEENVTVAYIQALRAAGKRDLIPIYASRLDTGRYVVTMGRVLEDVTSASEQDEMLKLLETYNLDNILILNDHLSHLLNEYVAPGMRDPRPLKMLEIADEGTLYPGQRIINGFLPDSATDQDLAIVRSLRWYSIVSGYWKETFYHLALALRKCLIAGRLACALSIVHEFPYENVSIRKSYQATGKSINPMDHEGAFPANEQARWELMIRQSRTYYELECVVKAIEALAIWREQENGLTGKKGKQLGMSAPSPGLRRAKEDVDEAMSIVLTGHVLQECMDHDEAADLEFIRNKYLPEMIIAYNTVLHSAGSVISRDNLIESMDLSVTIANEANGLTDCFVAAGRMRELVTSFAESSKAMLILKAAKQWTSKKEKEGKDLGIWEPTVTLSENHTRNALL